jgi:hypothetical protein
MKRVMLKSFAILMLAFALAGLTTQAQSPNQVKARIPFSFMIGSQRLPAGEYTIQYVNQNAGKTALLFKSADGRTSRIVNMMLKENETIQEKASLVFNQYAESYFLSEVWTGGDQYGLSLPRSRAERNLNELSKNEPKRVTVALTASR